MSMAPGSGKVVVFAGDTVGLKRLAVAFGEAGSRLVLEPPAGLGDVWRHIRADVSAMVVIDCCHGNAPSVWHREILSALESGIAVFGAGGIGALRAAELSGMGMTGAGRVFERVESGLLEADDEVLSGPDGFALVNLRVMLEQALPEGVITADEARALLRRSRSCFHSERSWAQVYKWMEEVVAPERRRRFDLFFKTHAVDTRSGDALRAVQTALSHFRPPVCMDVPSNCMRQMFAPRWRLSELFHRSFVAGEVVSGAEVLKRAEALQDSMMPRLKKDFFVRQWLKEHDIEPPQVFVKDFVRSAVEARGDNVVDFLLENGMTRCEWARLLEQDGLVGWAEQERAGLLPGICGKFCFAEDWAATHGVAAPDAGLPVGQWVIEKGPSFFGFVWEEAVAFLDALRLSGLAAQFVSPVAERGPYGT